MAARRGERPLRQSPAAGADAVASFNKIFADLENLNRFERRQSSPATAAQEMDGEQAASAS
jgi:hypothetical protein